MLIETVSESSFILVQIINCWHCSETVAVVILYAVNDAYIRCYIPTSFILVSSESEAALSSEYTADSVIHNQNST